MFDEQSPLLQANTPDVAPITLNICVGYASLPIRRPARITIRVNQGRNQSTWAATLRRIEKVEGRRVGGQTNRFVNGPALNVGQGPLKGHGDMHIGQILPNIWNPRLARAGRWILHSS